MNLFIFPEAQLKLKEDKRKLKEEKRKLRETKRKLRETKRKLRETKRKLKEDEGKLPVMLDSVNNEHSGLHPVHRNSTTSTSQPLNWPQSNRHSSRPFCTRHVPGFGLVGRTPGPFKMLSRRDGLLGRQARVRRAPLYACGWIRLRMLAHA